MKHMFKVHNNFFGNEPKRQNQPLKSEMHFIIIKLTVSTEIGGRSDGDFMRFRKRWSSKGAGKKEC